MCGRNGAVDFKEDARTGVVGPSSATLGGSALMDWVGTTGTGPAVLGGPMDVADGGR